MVHVRCYRPPLQRALSPPAAAGRSRDSRTSLQRDSIFCRRPSLVRLPSVKPAIDPRHRYALKLPFSLHLHANECERRFRQGIFLKEMQISENAGIGVKVPFFSTLRTLFAAFNSPTILFSIVCALLLSLFYTRAEINSLVFMRVRTIL